MLIGLPQAASFFPHRRVWGGSEAVPGGGLQGTCRACQAPCSAEASQPGGSVRHWAPRGHARVPARQRSWGGSPWQTHSSLGGQRPWCQERPSGSAAIPFTLSPPACSCPQARAAPHGTVLLHGPSCRESKPWWAGKPGAAAASPPWGARGPRPSRLPRRSNVLSPSLPPRAPRISKESQCQLSRHRRVSGSPTPGHACSGVCGQGCTCRGVHKKGRVCHGVP